MKDVISLQKKQQNKIDDSLNESLLKEFKGVIGYDFKDLSLLLKALTHSSYSNEAGDPYENNERLEFLGDAVLETCVSEELYNRYPTAREGDLTKIRAKLVNARTLAKIAKALGINRYILLGKGEESQGGRDRETILADTLEAILGAIFLDGGYESAKDVVKSFYKDLWPKEIKPISKKDHKSLLQEITQKIYKERPKYILIDSFGPEHAKIFQVEVVLPDGKKYQAKASSIKKAEQLAAKVAIKDIKKILDSY